MGRVGRGSPRPDPSGEAATGQAAEAPAEEARPAEEQAVGRPNIQAAGGVRGPERGQGGVAGVGLPAQGWSGRADDLDNYLWGGALSSGTQGQHFCREGPLHTYADSCSPLLTWATSWGLCPKK